jgi:hypothetical protein
MIMILLPSCLFASEPNDLNRDILGMDLKYFKKKYHRRVQGHDEVLPYCSDYKPNQEMEVLLTKAWHHKAGIINCRINFPCEERDDDGKWAVFGVAVDRLIYHFIDKKLFMVTLRFKQDSFDSIKKNLFSKYGKPSTAEILFWDNEVSTIKIIKMPRKDYYSLVYLHKELSRIYDMRKSNSKADDLLVGVK